jgi:glycosyltransferase involved in cell wall biosynthesis
MSKLISVCMIVKNEEAVLARCLDSIAGLWDELIIVDTGSTDRTIEIAESYGARVLHYEWIYPGDKSAARNMGIVQAVSQWVVVIDADEVFLHAKETRAALLNTPSVVDAIRVQFNNFDDAGQITLSWLQIRIFRRGKYEYKYREHEIPVAAAAKTQEEISNITIEHRPPTGRAETKSAPMMDRLVADVAENPGETHPLYFLHRECLNQRQYEDAIKYGEQFIEVGKAANLVLGDVYGNLATAYQKQGQTLNARRALLLAIAEEPGRREWWYRLGLFYVDCKELNLAIAALRSGQEIWPDYARQWEPKIAMQISNLIDYCQHELQHTLAHSHAHAH